MLNSISCCHLVGTTNVDLSAAHAPFGIVLLATIAALAVVDCRKLILPDHLNFLLAATGVCHSLALDQPSLVDAAAGAVIAAAFLLLVNAVYRRLRGADGLGLGDVKFVAAAGLWIGWQGLPFMLSVASTSALAFATIRAWRERKLDRTARLPFGPFLGLGALCSWAAMVTL